LEKSIKMRNQTHYWKKERADQSNLKANDEKKRGQRLTRTPMLFHQKDSGEKCHKGLRNVIWGSKKRIRQSWEKGKMIQRRRKKKIRPPPLKKLMSQSKPWMGTDEFQGPQNSNG